ncbi:MAG: hypothetical protein IPN79_03260 [Saprospiraceae bacterium]|nr:hypothetical protein [Saprospiraceae bacterium]
MMLRVVLICFFSFSGTLGFSQNFADEETNLLFYADVMNNASVAGHRIKAHDSFEVIFLRMLDKKGSFELPFDSLKWVSKIVPLDKSFRIFTWILDKGNGMFDHKGVLQNKKGQVFLLEDKLKDLDDWEFTISDNKEWLGAMYYQLKEQDDKEGRYYILFGLHRFSNTENIKLAEVLHFDKNDQPIFGKEVFFRENKDARDVVKTRLVLKYRSTSYVGLHFNEGMNMIIHDHLIPDLMSPSVGGVTLVSDGSLVGYEFKKGKWHYIDKIYTQVLDEAPRPNPVLDQRESTDLFGKPKKQKK